MRKHRSFICMNVHALCSFNNNNNNSGYRFYRFKSNWHKYKHFFFNFINVEIQELQVSITRSLYRLTYYTYLILVDINN